MSDTDVAGEPVLASCTFCGKSDRQVNKLIAGPGVYICNECVALCQQVLDAKPAKIPRLAPWQQDHDLDAVLENLPRIGMTRQSAWARFSGEE